MKVSEKLPSEGNRSVPGLIDQMPVSIVKAKATMEFESRIYMKSVCKKFISQGSPALLFQFPLLRFHYTDAYRAWASRNWYLLSGKHSEKHLLSQQVRPRVFALAFWDIL